MTAKRASLRFFLDEGVPDSAGQALAAAGHEVIYLRKSAIATGSPDPLVCAAAQAADAILVAIDGDMKVIAKTHGVGGGRFKNLSLVKLSCRESKAAERLQEAMSLLEHEWVHGSKKASGRRLFIEIGASSIRTHR